MLCYILYAAFIVVFSYKKFVLFSILFVNCSIYGEAIFYVRMLSYTMESTGPVVFTYILSATEMWRSSSLIFSAWSSEAPGFVDRYCMCRRRPHLPLKLFNPSSHSPSFPHHLTASGRIEPGSSGHMWPDRETAYPFSHPPHRSCRRALDTVSVDTISFNIVFVAC